MPSAILGGTSVCPGSAETLTDFFTGGMWTSSNTAVATIDPIAGILIGHAPGSTVILYTFPTGCAVVTTINITSLPTIYGATNFCVGNSITLTDVTTGGTWSSSNSAIASIGTGGTVSGVSSGTATITYSGIGCVATHPVTVNPGRPIAMHSVSISDTSCGSPDFYISTCDTSSFFNVTTWFGDGNSANTPLITSGTSYADVFHSYNAPGTYFVKQVLRLGTSPQDSITFPYEYQYCRTIPVKLYMDANSDCIFDTGDQAMLLPVLTEIDSNGIPVDTISSTSGFYYKALGLAGTVYAFRIISPPGIIPTCPATGILYDTIQTATIYQPAYFALNCSGSTSFDLQEHVSTMTGRHMQNGTIIVNNAFCLLQNAVITVHFSPKYVYGSAYPVPTTVSGNTLTWSVTGITSTSFPTINYTVNVPDPWSYTTWLIPGDTVNSNYVTIRTSTGFDTTNIIIKNDTVKSSFDPNEMSVFPAGNILSCTPLQYTIRFQNTGNDTAHNISIMDTLSDNLDIRSLNMEIASSAMNIAILNDGVHNIAKFDFPNINLLDSRSSRSMLRHGRIQHKNEVWPGRRHNHI